MWLVPCRRSERPLSSKQGRSTHAYDTPAKAKASPRAARTSLGARDLTRPSEHPQGEEQREMPQIDPVRPPADGHQPPGAKPSGGGGAAHDGDESTPVAPAASAVAP